MQVQLDALSDITKLTVSQMGSAESEFMLERQFLDNDKAYCAAVSKFDIDLGGTHMLSSNPMNYNLLEIKRRNVGQDFETTDLTIQHPTVRAQNSHIFRVDPADGVVNTAGEFIRLMNRFFATFDELHRRSYQVLGADFDAIGAAFYSDQFNNQGVTAQNPLGTYLLQVSLNESGRIVIQGSQRFWCNFFIQLSEYGQRILGFSNPILCVSLVNGVITQDMQRLVDVNGLVAASGLQDVFIYGSDQSLFRGIDSRLGILVNLVGPNVPNYVVVQNNQETIGAAVVDEPYPSKITMETDFQSLVFDFGEDVTLSQVITKPKEWFRLDSVLDLRFFRVQVNLRRRDFDPINKAWVLSTSPIDLGENDFWNVQFTFVSI